VIDVFDEGGADAALLAGVLHDGTLALPTLKRGLAEAGVAVRRAS
jgi:imidazole glycerol phosphate synthase subunit HisF